ncbi:hypothetical protein A1O7_03546 [Cladophialophora yegresii CBS 114405]|uniref:Uncharacterized protein n=1 Tax=Cladophialophora yegresii CBS 114405 TaxID=1182544 RepID=W9WEU9_9EURO|nr:uncharacterized protein A1O7_03546 [Cladophialophora yegresii CBS 114405]EXJ63101.1 hypothetical protein A1O7_03546 [Cladophialophora yegresii CBS 114405]
MGLSDGLVVFLCILVAGIVVAGAAAMHRVYASREFTAELPRIPDDQANYMRTVRARKWPLFQYEARQVAPPSTNTSAV